ncbi:hypothetical protein PHACT_03695 [Pseudohongiella acticola]|uniref:Uncharacterized protein n=1 Tax=Pseudohongiella acticola TaxID=1524254 RepID=A0A1E8CIY4_9GAMM|nr:hypothetical protein [Pseudohongiella acticola]OFE12349.1 hypothetical protein PHACT_03695 [Pseudohongiella acticola]
MTKSNVQPPLHPQGNGPITQSADHTGKQILVPANSDIYIKARYKENFGSFQAISPLRTSETSGPDIFDLLASVSHSSFKVFNKLKAKRNEKNSLCHYRTDKLSKSEREMFNRGVRQLVGKNIIKRVPVSSEVTNVRKNTYMINPVIIKCWEYEEACSVWMQLD